eukprot:PhM_4_TR16580/c0_g2_i1/m.53291
MTDVKLELSVSNARREFEEGGKVKNLPFWVYFVTCRTTLPKYVDTVGQRQAGDSDGVTLTVWRRYNDFLWLRTTLVRMYSGHIIPPVPQKDIAGMMDKVMDLVAGDEETEDWRKNDFIAFRLRSLDLFLKFLGRCSVAETDVVRNFLCMTNHAEWASYKNRVEAELARSAPSWSDAISSSASGAFSKLRSLVTGSSAQEDPKKLPAGSPVAKIQSQCRSYESWMTHLYHITMRMMLQERNMTGGPPVNFEWSLHHDPKAPVPVWLISVGHRVASPDGHLGTVRYIGPADDTNNVLVGVEWSSEIGDSDGVAPNFQRYFQTREKCASFVQPQFLYYPSNGVADPVLLASKEASVQIDSYLVPCTSAMLKRLTRLVDQTYFWRLYATVIVESIERFEGLEADRKRLQDALDKETRPDKQTSLRAKLDAAVKTARESEEVFMRQYHNFFIPEQSAAMREVLELYVSAQKELSANGMTWESRLKPVLRSLETM